MPTTTECKLCGRLTMTPPGVPPPPEFEGLFRSHMVRKGRNRDTAWYAIVDSEWPAIRRGFERWLAKENFDSEDRQRRTLGELIREGR